MNNLFISDLDLKDAAHFTNQYEQIFRRKFNRCFRYILSQLDRTHVIMPKRKSTISNDEYFAHASHHYIPLSCYQLKKNKHNIIVDRYPQLDDNENYIFVGTHVCPEDIEMILNVIDRNAHVVFGSLDLQKHDPEIFFLWLLNGIIPFDIMDKKERKEMVPKMIRVLKSNSILIFPEASHNLSPNKIINHLFDGPVNAAEQSGSKIVAVSYLRDNEKNISYVDFSSPLDIKNLNVDIDHYYPGKPHNEKYRVKAKTEYLRDQMATSKYYLMEKHFAQLKRRNFNDIEETLRQDLVFDSLSKLNYTENVDFHAEYLTKQTDSEKEYEEVVKDLFDLEIRHRHRLKNQLDKETILKYLDLDRKNVPKYFQKSYQKLQKNL